MYLRREPAGIAGFRSLFSSIMAQSCHCCHSFRPFELSPYISCGQEVRFNSMVVGPAVPSQDHSKPGHHFIQLYPSPSYASIEQPTTCCVPESTSFFNDPFSPMLPTSLSCSRLELRATTSLSIGLSGALVGIPRWEETPSPGKSSGQCAAIR